VSASPTSGVYFCLCLLTVFDPTKLSTGGNKSVYTIRSNRITYAMPKLSRIIGSR
jgi:hypothetical protein